MTSLKQKWDNLLEKNPKTRIRAAATELGVSELELLALNIGDTVTVLNPDFDAFLDELEPLGELMALTRNESVVHERKGVYKGFSASPHAALFVNEDIDLRLFTRGWKFLLAEVVETTDTTKRSFQVFDKHGTAIHKIYATKETNVEAFDALKSKYVVDKAEAIVVEKKELVEKELVTLSEEDKKAFQDEWVNLKDTHQFFGMVRKYNLGRTQALELAPSEHFAKKVDNGSLHKALTLASEDKTPIMVFVGNAGCIQIHTGEVNKIMEFKTWTNVMDPKFNLHANQEDILESWVVRKPTEDGEVTALEVYDKNKELIVTLFGKRKPGIPELTEWRTIVEKL